jgi:hypothetical protein
MGQSEHIDDLLHDLGLNFDAATEPEPEVNWKRDGF